jgi:hypothetical protein
MARCPKDRPARGRRELRGAGAAASGLALCVALTVLTRSAAALELDAPPLGRWTVGGYGELYGVIRTDPETQRQRPAGTFRLNLTGDVHTSARVFLDSRMLVGGWPEHGTGLGLYDISDTFQNDSPAVDIEEGYLDLYLGPVDLRVGKQKFAWGKLDSFQPTDVLNPRWYNDPFITEEQDAKIGIPALQASYFLPSFGDRLPADVSLTAVWVPVPVSTRFALQEERWFPPATAVADVLTLRLEFPEDNFIPVRVENDLDTVNRGPAHQLDEGAVGLRLAGLSGAADWALYYYDGQETDPVLDFAPSIVRPAGRRARRTGGDPPPLVPPAGEPLRLRSLSDLIPRFERIRMVGADLAYEIAGFTMRAEGAYGMDRLLPRTIQGIVSEAVGSIGDRSADELVELADQLQDGLRVPLDVDDLFVTTDTVEWGAGIDYLYRGWTPLLQINQTVVLDDVPKLLLSRIDTQLVFVLRKAFLAERLQSEIAAAQGLARGYTTGIARFTYELTDHLRAQLGYLLIAGSRETLAGQFHDNDQGFVQVRYSF